jgi:hypothetical protein
MTEDDRTRALELARLFGLAADASASPPPVADFELAVHSRMDALGVAEIEAPPSDEGEEDPTVFAWWLLRMARTTYARLLAPPEAVDGAVLARFEALLAGRPSREAEHAQLHIDAASALRRAQAIDARAPAGRILAVGDDDAVTVALALLERRELAAVDIDPRILAFLREAGREAGVTIETHEIDLFRDPIPPSLRRACVAAVADPIRSGEASLQFLLFGVAGLARTRESRLFFCDHPDWSFEHDDVMDALASAGLDELEVLEDLHRYPLSLDVFPARARTAAAVGIEPAWLDALIAATAAWSHLYVLAFRG